MNGLREFFKKALPRPVVDWIRRRLRIRRYLRALSYELLARDALDAEVAARGDGLDERLVRDVLERTDIVLQQLDRKIEGVSARHGERLAELERQVRDLSEAIERLRAATEPPARANRA